MHICKIKEIKFKILNDVRIANPQIVVKYTEMVELVDKYLNAIEGFLLRKCEPKNLKIKISKLTFPF